MLGSQPTCGDAAVGLRVSALGPDGSQPFYDVGAQCSMGGPFEAGSADSGHSMRLASTAVVWNFDCREMVNLACQAIDRVAYTKAKRRCRI